MRKIAVVWSSPNADGLTASAKDQFVKGLTDAGAQVEEIHLKKRSWSIAGLAATAGELAIKQARA